MWPTPPGPSTPGTQPPRQRGSPRPATPAPERSTAGALRRYLAHLGGSRYAARTITRKLSVLRRYFDWARRTGLIDADPTLGLAAPSGRSRLPQVLKHDQIHTLIEKPARAGDDDARDARDLAIVELLYGQRPSGGANCAASAAATLELARLQTRVWGKGAKQRLVPLSEPAAAALRVWLEHHRQSFVTEKTPADAVFLNQRGRVMTPRDVRRVLDRRSVVPTHPHAPAPHLRHPSARRGVPTCGPCRSCWATPTSPPPRSTPTSAASASARSIAPRTPEREAVAGRCRPLR